MTTYCNPVNHVVPLTCEELKIITDSLTETINNLRDRLNSLIDVDERYEYNDVARALCAAMSLREKLCRL